MEEKTNEIMAVPELLDLIAVEGAVVTADAMSCQKKIAEKITGVNAVALGRYLNCIDIKTA